MKKILYFRIVVPFKCKLTVFRIVEGFAWRLVTPLEVSSSVSQFNMVRDGMCALILLLYQLRGVILRD